MPLPIWLARVVYFTTEYTLHPLDKLAIGKRKGPAMHFTDLVLLGSGGLVIAGIAYPSFAAARPGWKVGAWIGGTFWSIWFGMGALAYLAGVASVFGWPGLLLALPLAFLIGLGAIVVAGPRTQALALPGPILANLWLLS